MIQDEKMEKTKEKQIKMDKTKKTIFIVISHSLMISRKSVSKSLLIISSPIFCVYV